MQSDIKSAQWWVVGAVEAVSFKDSYSRVIQFHILLQTSSTSLSEKTSDLKTGAASRENTETVKI